MAYEIIHEEPEPLTGLWTGVPMELEFLIGQCLEKEEAERYRSVADVGVDLENLGEKLKASKSVVVSVATGGRR